MWEITSKKAKKIPRGTNFYDFRLRLHDQSEEADGQIPSLTGKKLYLPSNGGAVKIKGTSNFSNGEGLSLKTQSPSLQPSESLFESEDSFQAKIEGKETVKLLGEDLLYDYGKESTISASNFRITYNGEEGKIEIAGKKLRWKIEGKIRMKKNVKAKTESGWKIKAEEMTFHREEKILAGSGGIKFITEDKKVSGDSFTYNLEEDSIKIEGGVRALFFPEEEN